MKLHNKVDKRVLKERIEKSEEPRTTISFYKYARIGNPQVFRDHLYLHWEKLDVFGRVHIATEGINAQISVPTSNLDQFKSDLDEIVFLRGVRLNFAVEDDGKSFYKLKLKVRDKILADGLNDTSFDVSNKGQHLTAKEWNSMMENGDVILVDMRNHYESEVGHFQGAMTPDVDTFRGSLNVIDELLEEYKDKNIMMYCTGGIRCEKASAWYKHRGYKNVYQLDGGIIKYAHEVQDQNLDVKYRGKNFVFDDRLGERISNEVIAHCHQCGAPCDEHTNCLNVGCNLLFIQCESCKKKMQNTCSDECKEIIQLPEEEQRARRAGIKPGRKVFKKGRSEKLAFMKPSAD
ncbi:rhodanese-related sulfurtransferase [Salibacteraceae bacterium]|jgi:UPF0176 protein|nr:rhodanese-related sulfurtransferase [Salibacteraceae bacterium]